VTTASVLVPTHDHASTLALTVRSALGQTHADLEVLIIGDGVSDEVRTTAHALVAEDERVRFLDNPKGPHHGEIHRDAAIRQATGEHIVYCCDDDLLLPEHVADLSGMLERLDFVQSRNGYLDSGGRVGLYAGDLADPAYIALLLREDQPYNFVSLTGSAHTKSYYARTGRPWETTPAGRFPDHHQWRRMFSSVAPRAATSLRMTALQFPSHLDSRATWSAEDRFAELASWVEELPAPGTQDRVDRLVAEACWREVLAVTRHQQYWRPELDARDELDAMRATRTWRWSAPLRRIRGLRGGAGPAS
jgi:hypothetical protein